MARYSIEDTTLTALGDAVRSKTGETEYRDISYTSKAYQLVGGLAADGGYIYLYIPVCGATQMKLNKLASTGDNTTIYLHQCDVTCDDDSILFGTNTTKCTFSNFTSDSIRLYSIVEGTYDFEITWYDADGNQMEVVINDEVPKTMTPERMATEINGIAALESSLLNITGNMRYKFYAGNWDNFIVAYGDKVTTNNISNLSNTFAFSSVGHIPFEINCSSSSAVECSSCFDACNVLVEPPVINNLKVGNLQYMFRNCQQIRYFPEGYGEDWDWSQHTSATSAYSGYKSAMFDNCYSLRKLPMGLYKYGNPVLSVSYHPLRDFRNLYSLDEVVDLPYPHNTECKGTSSSSLFYNTLTGLYRCKEFTFAPDIGVKKWAKQTLDLSSLFGVLPDSGEKYILNYNSGITADKAVTNDTTYQALKDDPDWYAVYTPYSRYNHDSAVNTINSLPDCSEYAAANGTNTIKFKGAAGEKTDGGAINTLTDEEIAVAAAKGWTVTLV